KRSVPDFCTSCPLSRVTSVRPFRIGNFVRGHDPRPERSGGGEILARGHREFLVVADAAVDETGIAGDMLERALDGDMAAASANDHGELPFEVEALRHRRADHFTLMADERIGEPN